MRWRRLRRSAKAPAADQCGRISQQFGGGCRGEWFAEQIPLAVFAGHAGEMFELRFSLDAFGRHRHAQVMSERHDRSDDLSVLGAAVETGDEAAVDLHCVNREFLEISQRTVSGAEIVDVHASAERFEPAQYGGGLLGVD